MRKNKNIILVPDRNPIILGSQPDIVILASLFFALGTGKGKTEKLRFLSGGSIDFLCLFLLFLLGLGAQGLITTYAECIFYGYGFHFVNFWPL